MYDEGRHDGETTSWGKISGRSSDWSVLGRRDEDLSATTVGRGVCRGSARLKEVRRYQMRRRLGPEVEEGNTARSSRWLAPEKEAWSGLGLVTGVGETQDGVEEMIEWGGRKRVESQWSVVECWVRAEIERQRER